MSPPIKVVLLTRDGTSRFDPLWPFAMDSGEGLAEADRDGVLP